MNELKCLYKMFVPVFALCIIILTSCGNEINSISRPLLGTVVTITVDTDPSTAASAVSAAFDEIERIEKVFSIYNPGSAITGINNGAYSGCVKVDDEILEILKLSDCISKKTGGAFDITFASLGKLWDFSSENFTPPSSFAIKKILPAFSYKNIIIDDEKKTVRFMNRDTKIGFGGIAKGYAVKRAVSVLRKNGVKNGIVACAGDIQVLGSKRGMPWIVGVMNPREKSVIATIGLNDGECISTSGDYERYKFYGGKRYHHIINPATGYPSESGLISVTVLCDDSVLADSYATAIFIMGLNRTKKFLESEKNISVVLVTDKLKIYVSEKLRNRIEFKEGFDFSYI